MKLILTVFAIVLMSGCASYTGVVKVDDNSFMIARQASTGFHGRGTMPEDNLKDANQFCEYAGKKAEVTRIYNTEPPYILGRYPRSEIYFDCK